MVEHSMQKSHIRQINDKECAPFHTECALHVVHTKTRESVATYAQTKQNKAYHILWFVYDVPCYFIVGWCCLPLDWLSPLLLCNRFVRIHHAIFSSSFSLVFFRELVSISLFVSTHKNNGKGIRQQSQKTEIYAKYSMQSITVNVFVA